VLWRPGSASRGITRHWLLLLFAISLIIRLVAIGRESLWYDEVFTAMLARGSFDRLIAATASDVHPPLWYALEWAIVRLIGPSESALRLPSAIFSSAAIYEMARLIDRLAGRKAAILAGAGAILMPGMIYYGQEARVYALMAWLTMRGLWKIEAGKPWELFPLAGLLLYTHNLGIVYAGLLGLLALLRHRSKAWLPFGLAGAAWLPWLPTAIMQARAMTDNYWISLGGPGAAISYMMYNTFFTRTPQWAQPHTQILAFALTLISLYVLLPHARRLHSILAMAFVPAGMLYAISTLWQPVLVERLLIPSGLALIGVWGVAISKLSGAASRRLAVLAAPMLALALITYWGNAELQRPDYRRYAAPVLAHWQSGDVIYHASLSTYLPIRYYLPESFDTFLWWERGSLAISLSDETRTQLGIDQDYRPFRELRAAGYRRVWLYYVDNMSIPASEVWAMRGILAQCDELAWWNLRVTKRGRTVLYLLRL